MKKAIITGVTGQDGSYLSELLLEKEYEVYGFVRRTSNSNLQRINHLIDNPNFNLLYGDVTDQSSIMNAIKSVEPDEFYNLAAMSFVGESWNQPILTAQSIAIGTLNCLESIRLTNKNIKYYQASSSELFGKVREMPQNELTPLYPRSPYGVSKAFGHYMTINYRESYDMFACSGILFNHGSERRGKEFVTRKISDGIARIKLGLSDHIILGNLDAKRDWGHSQDFVRAMWMMLQQKKPDDYVIATGETHSVRDFLDIAFNVIGIKDWSKYIIQDAKFMRPSDVSVLLGDASKAERELGWISEISFTELVERMVKNDIKILEDTK